MPDLTIISADQAKRFVLANVGATLPKRDAVDARIVKQVETVELTINQSARCLKPSFSIETSIDSYKIGVLLTPVKPEDILNTRDAIQRPDNDGIPDEWERKTD